QRIFVSVRACLIEPPLDEAGSLEVLQPVAERRIGDAGGSAEIVVAADAGEKVAQDQDRPAITDHRERAGDRAHHPIEALQTHGSLTQLDSYDKSLVPFAHPLR